MTKDLRRLVSPRSVAIVGGRWADPVAQNCRAFGFKGPIYRVHPERAAAGQEGFWPSLEALPTVPDCAFLGINPEATIAAVRQLRTLGAGGAVCLASGFAERATGDGLSHNVRLLEAAGDLPLLGPNCLGMINFFDRISLFPDDVVAKPLERGACVIAQSGTVCLDILFAKRHLPLGYLFSTGNQSSVSSVDLAYMALNDPRVSAVGIYLESAGDPAALRDLACFARDRKIPIVVIKTGRSEVAQRITLNHTGAMASSDQYLDALLARVGIGRCETLAELMETLKLLHVHGPFPGNRLSICGASGGDMAIASDVLQELEVDLPEMSAKTRGELAKILGDAVTIGNPLDFQTATWHDESKLRSMFSTIQDGEADLYGFFLDHPISDRKAVTEPYELPIRAFLTAAQETKARTFIASALPESTPGSIAELALRAGVAPMQGTLETFKAFEVASKIGAAWGNFHPPRIDRSVMEGPARNLSEFEAKKILAGVGIRTPQATEVLANDAARAAEAIGFPVVMKVSSQDIAHKTELNGVALNVDSQEKATIEAVRLGSITDRILVEEMISDGIAEFIIGVNFDPDFGPVVLLGAGGVLAELLEDSVIFLPPFTREDVLTQLKTLRSFRLLSGYRRRPEGDVEALISAVMSAADLAQDRRVGVIELEINPIIVRAKGSGAVAVDSLIRSKGIN